MFSPLLRLATLAALLAAASAAHAMPLGYGDPTQPVPLNTPPAAGAASAAPAKPDWILSSTLVAGSRRVAVINGRSVALGGTIDGARLVAVDARGVALDVAGRRVRLELPASEGSTVRAKTPRGSRP